MIDPLQDGISAVNYVGHYGDDLFVINRGRRSFNNKSTKVTPWGERFLQGMAAKGHWTPFGHPVVTLEFRMPIFIVREWETHKVGFVKSEASRRDITTEPQMWVVKAWREAPTEEEKRSMHQRSSDRLVDLEVAESLTRAQEGHYRMARALYRNMINAGVAPELARVHLPVGTYVEFDETGTLAAWARLARLRNHPDAQAEIQKYAQAVDEIIRPLFPVAWGALVGS